MNGTLSVDLTKFSPVGLSASAIVSGLIAKRMSSSDYQSPQFFDNQRQGMEKTGIVLLASGLAYLGWYFYTEGPAGGDSWIAKNRHVFLAGACAAIFGGVMVVSVESKRLEEMYDGNGDGDFESDEIADATARMRAGMLAFVAGWFALGYGTSIGRDPALKWMAVAAPGLVVASVLLVLPWQRDAGEVDGPGYVLFVAGLALLAALNSAKFTKT